MAGARIRGPDRFNTWSVVRGDDVLMAGMTRLGAELFLEQLLDKCEARRNPALTSEQWEKIPENRRAVVTEARFVLEHGKWVPAVIVEAIHTTAAGSTTQRRKVKAQRGPKLVVEKWVGAKPGTKTGSRKVFAAVPAAMILGTVTMPGDAWWDVPTGRKFTTVSQETVAADDGSVMLRQRTTGRYIWNANHTKLTRVTFSDPMSKFIGPSPRPPDFAVGQTEPKKRRANPQLMVLGNPCPTELSSATVAYRKFHGVEPKTSSKIPNGTGRVLIALGELTCIDYRPSRGSRKGPTWWHKFGPGVVLASDADGQNLYIVDRKTGKRLVDWTRGIVR